MTKMVQAISGDYWGHYKGNEAEARVYAREVTVSVFGHSIPSVTFQVESFDAATGKAELSTGWHSSLQTVRYSKNPQKVLQFGSAYTMPMERQFTDPEPPSPLIPSL